MLRRAMIWGVLLGLAACTPLTAHRQSTRVGHMAPAPWSGAVAEHGDVWVSGGTELAGSIVISESQYTGEVVESLLPLPGDPGLQISPWRSYGQVRWGVSKVFELGLRGAIDHPGSEVPTRLGVFEAGTSPSFMIAPTVGAEGRLGSTVGIVGRVEPRLTFMPYTRYELIDPSNEGVYAPGEAREFYKSTVTGMSRRLLWSGSTAVVFHLPNQRGDIHTGFTIAEQVTNNGFSSVPSDPAQRGAPAFLLTLGGAAQVQGFRVGGQLWVHPFDENRHGLAMPHLGMQLIVEGRVRKGAGQSSTESLSASGSSSAIGTNL